MTDATSAGYDLVVRGGRLVSDGSIVAADLGISGGTIRQVGGPMAGRRQIDARGKLVVPGGVDAHVHLTSPPGAGWRWVDDFASGGAAAAAGGITSLGNMTACLPGESLVEGLRRVERLADATSIVDYTLHPIVEDPTEDVADELADLPARGYTSIKVFAFDDPHSASWRRVIAAAAARGLVTMAHCEDGAANRMAERRLLASGRTGVIHHPDSRPARGEALATARLLAAARETAAPVYIVHLSSAAALQAVRAARRRGQAVWVETRPAYLHLTRERYAEPDGARYVCFPPLREPHDRAALWSALSDGDIDTVASDHAPLSRAQILDPELRVGTFRGAMPGLEILRPLLFSEGVVTGQITVEQWVDVTATNPARTLGMHPRKGTLSVGADADVVVWDPDRVRAIRAAEMQSRCDFDAFEGWTVRGWPAVTLSRGEIICERGGVVAEPGRGRRIMRSTAPQPHKGESRG